MRNNFVPSNLIAAICYVLILSCCVIKTSCGARILGLFPTASFSHQQPMLALSYALAARGHNLTILTANPSKIPVKNVRAVDLSSLYEDWEEMQKSGVVSLQEKNNKFQLIRDVCKWSSFTIGAVIRKKEFKEFLREVNGTKFDLILYEPLHYSSLLGVRELIGNPPVVSIITLHKLMTVDDPMGNPFMPSYIPSVWLNNSDKMNIWERFLNALAETYSRYILYSCIFPAQEKYLKQIVPDIKRTAVELEFDRSLLIASIDFATGYPRALQPNTIFVGPLHFKEPIPLPEDLQNWMDGCKDGIIYFSMGSNMKGTSIPDHIRAAFIKAFKRLANYRVIWKWEADTKLPDQPDNVLIKKWLPQRSIFAHPKLKVFISQCGLQSFQEAIDSGIPILGIPMFGDQELNSKRLVYTGAGLTLEFNEITFEDVYEKLNDLLTNTSYKENMLRLSKIAKDKPMPSMDTAIWWVEYALRHNGAPHLRPASLDLEWYQYFMLDILLIILICAFIIFYISYLILRLVINRLFALYFSRNNVKVKKN